MQAVFMTSISYRVREIGIIGVGRLGSVFARILHKKGYELILIDKNKESLELIKNELKERIKISDRIAEAAHLELVIVSVKPGYVEEVMRELSSNKPPAVTQLIISCAAGIPIKKLETWSNEANIIRIMPNICIEAEAAVIAYTKGTITNGSSQNKFFNVFWDLGKCIEVNEELIDPLTAASGSGPAFIAYFADAMIKETVKEGVSLETATAAVSQTLIGVGKMMQNNWSSEKIMQTVASPGGTTEAGLKMLDQGNVKITISKAMNQATQKARELGK